MLNHNDKFAGISTNTTILPQHTPGSDEISEITLKEEPTAEGKAAQQGKVAEQQPEGENAQTERRSHDAFAIQVEEAKAGKSFTQPMEVAEAEKSLIQPVEQPEAQGKHPEVFIENDFSAVEDQWEIKSASENDAFARRTLEELRDADNDLFNPERTLQPRHIEAAVKEPKPIIEAIPGAVGRPGTMGLLGGSAAEPDTHASESGQSADARVTEPDSGPTDAAARDIGTVLPESNPQENMVEPEWETGQDSIIPGRSDDPDGNTQNEIGQDGSGVLAEAVQPDEKPEEYEFPPISLLTPAKPKKEGGQGSIQETADKLQQTLANFGVRVTITDATCGPTVTRYELQPEMGVKVSKIVNLADDIKLNLAAEDIRIEAPIPGKAAIGIEVPNHEPTVVSFRELMESESFQQAQSPISFAAGKDIGGNIMIADIAKMPHVLIAGATGSGKSVCINTIIMSILFKAHPDDVKFIMIDPKVVELSVYNGIPHLLIPVVTDPKKAAGALHWAVKEMMDRYDRFAKAGVRDMKGYNAKIHNGRIRIEQTNGQSEEVAASKMPQIIVIVDELADLMMVASNEVEEAICRLAQLARAAGIHLVIATQRPSVNVITGLIKANMPSRIAFSVTSGVDSRTILDMTGAEKLLGKGDMLYYPQGLSKPLRVQGAFVTDEDVAKVVDFIRAHSRSAGYDPAVVSQVQEAAVTATQAVEIGAPERNDDKDQYYDEAARLLIEKEKGSIGMLQRYFKIGFNRAARIMDQLEEGGVVGPEEGTKPRRILMTLAQYEGGGTEGADDEPGSMMEE